jgi:hypothetical protein
MVKSTMCMRGLVFRLPVGYQEDWEQIMDMLILVTKRSSLLPRCFQFIKSSFKTLISDVRD